MNILLVPTSDWVRHPVPSRLHFIFEKLAEKNNVHVVHFQNKRWRIIRGTDLKLHSSGPLPLRDLALYYTLNSPFHYESIKKIIKEEGIEVVIYSHILAGTSSIISGHKSGIPVVCDYLDHFPESASIYYDNSIVKTVVGKAVQGITSWNLGNSDSIVTVSSHFKDMLNDMGYLNVSIIPNGVDTMLFRQGDKERSLEYVNLGKLRDKFIICYVGSIERWVDLDGVIEAVKKLNSLNKDVVFLLVGGSIAGSYYGDLVEDSHYIVSTGFVDYSLVPYYINASDVCVLPLKNMRKNLTVPLKILQYMACGKPVFSLPNAEVEKRFGDAVYTYNDSDDLVDGVLKLNFDDSEYKEKMSIGRRYAQMYSWENIRHSYVNLLENLVQKRCAV